MPSCPALHAIYHRLIISGHHFRTLPQLSPLQPHNKYLESVSEKRPYVVCLWMHTREPRKKISQSIEITTAEDKQRFGDGERLFARDPFYFDWISGAGKRAGAKSSLISFCYHINLRGISRSPFSERISTDSPSSSCCEIK